MKKVLFIILPYAPDAELLVKHKLRSFVAHPYGVLSIATYLQRNSECKVTVFDCNTSPDWKKDLCNTITNIHPDIVGLSMMFDCSYWSVHPITNVIREFAPQSTIVIGGASATASYTTILKEQPEIEAVCYGEGEIPFWKLVIDGNDAFKSTPSWVTRSKNSVPIRCNIQNLDEVIDIDYSLIDLKEYPMQESFSPYAAPKPRYNQFFLISSRGCPFSCSFCINSANMDKFMRYASVDAVIKHVRKLVDIYEMDVLTFYDDQLLLNKKRAKEIFRRLADFKLRIECPNGLSVAFIDDELAGLMKSAGMDTVNLAIESGSPYVLNKLIHKPLKISQVQPVVDILRKHGFWINGYFVFGVPGETDEHRQETVKAIKEWGLDWACISNACPTRGSLLYKECIENGYIPEDMKISDLDMNKYIITTPDQSPGNLTKDSYRINLDINFVNNHRMKTGDYEMAMRAFLDVIKRYPDHAFAYYYIAKCAGEIAKQKIEASEEWRSYLKAGQDDVDGVTVS